VAAGVATLVAVGTLGLITGVDVDGTDAFLLRRRMEFWPFGEIIEGGEAEFESCPHFSFFWTRRRSCRLSCLPTAGHPGGSFFRWPRDL
jgi:hypothetical protein